MKKLLLSIGIAAAILAGGYDSATHNQSAPVPALAIPKPKATHSPAWHSVSVLATAYVVNRSARGCEVYPGRTASGVMANSQSIAVDTHVFKFGTKFHVKGWGYGIAQDTGGYIKGHHIDLAFESCAKAIAWGARRITVRYQ